MSIEMNRQRKKIGDSDFDLSNNWVKHPAHKPVSALAMFAHHAKQAWKSFNTAPLTSILTAFTISVTLLVFAVFILLIENIKGVIVSARTEVAVSIYFKEGVPTSEIAAMEKMIEARPYIEEAVYRSKEQALSEFRKTLGERAIILDGLERSNPLPASLEVTFKDEDGVESLYRPFAEELAGQPNVEHIEYSRSLIDRLSQFLRYFGLIGLLSVIFMLIVTGFIITNTIKLALYAHREEIEIMSLVGATDSFIRAPYMIEGFFQGLLGAFVAIFFTYLIYVFLGGFIAENEVFHIFLPALSFISLRSALLITVSGITVGALGSFLAVRSFLKKDI